MHKKKTTNLNTFSKRIPAMNIKTQNHRKSPQESQTYWIVYGVNTQINKYKNLHLYIYIYILILYHIQLRNLCTGSPGYIPSTSPQHRPSDPSGHGTGAHWQPPWARCAIFLASLAGNQSNLGLGEIPNLIGFLLGFSGYIYKPLLPAQHVLFLLGVFWHHQKLHFCFRTQS